MINIEEMLKPVAEKNPCGEDFSYHPAYQSLETLARGEFKSTAPDRAPEWQEPDWKEVRQGALEILNQSKHLGTSIILSLSLLKLEGMDGFRQGLGLIRGMVEKYWADLYPRLDPEDNNDPTERLNSLNNLSSPAKPYNFILHLKGVTLCRSSRLGKVTFQQILDLKDASGKPEGKTSESSSGVSEIQAAFLDAGPETAKATLGAIQEAIGHAHGIDQFLEQTLGSGNGVNFSSLRQILSEMKQSVEAYAPNIVPDTSVSPTEAKAPAATMAITPSGSGVIQSRADVVKALEKICEYYAKSEPSSPIPLLLKRALKLVDKDFLTISSELTPDVMPKLKSLFGIESD